MEKYQSEFLKLCSRRDILSFASPGLETAPKTPQFLDASLFNDGELLSGTTHAYAEHIKHTLGLEPPFLLYGLAYKGIPLATATAMQLSQGAYPVDYAFNRKQPKAHGEGGSIVGAPLQGDVVIIDNVLTSGDSVNHAARVIQKHGATLRAVVVALDREQTVETADGNRLLAREKLEKTYPGVSVNSILKLQDINEYAKQIDLFTHQAGRLHTKSSNLSTHQAEPHQAERRYKYRAEFLALCVKHNILRFGEFRLKSGRVSPYFFNAGLFNNGEVLKEIAQAYATLLEQELPQQPYLLYGPAYKGIPLAVATSMKIPPRYRQQVSLAFNRKEATDKTDDVVGAPLREKNVIIIDDVITAGTSINQAAELIRQHGATLRAVVVALDRQEIADNSQQSAIQAFAQTHKVPVHSILKLQDIIAYADKSAKQSKLFARHAERLYAYQARYGVAVA